jgi:hypothetical protein
MPAAVVHGAGRVADPAVLPDVWAGHAAVPLIIGLHHGGRTRKRRRTPQGTCVLSNANCSLEAASDSGCMVKMQGGAISSH